MFQCARYFANQDPIKNQQLSKNAPLTTEKDKNFPTDVRLLLNYENNRTSKKLVSRIKKAVSVFSLEYYLRPLQRILDTSKSYAEFNIRFTKLYQDLQNMDVAKTTMLAIERDAKKVIKASTALADRILKSKKYPQSNIVSNLNNPTYLQSFLDGTSFRIKNVSIQKASSLRKNIQKLFQSRKSFDFDSFVEMIQDTIEVPTKKARSLAISETRILHTTTVYQQYKDNRVEYFTWRSMKDRYVRLSHAEFNNKTYRLDTGAYDKRIGQWVWPGSYYGCRCIALPIINPAD